MKNPNPILIIEDDPDDCEFLQTTLDELGITNEQICFSNGEEALKYLQETTLKTFIIISDVNMPKMNGIELKANINKDERLRRQSIPFIFLSTSAVRSQVELAYDELIQGYFIKPISSKELKKFLELILEYWDNTVHPNSVTLA